MNVFLVRSCRWIRLRVYTIGCGQVTDTRLLSPIVILRGDQRKPFSGRSGGMQVSNTRGSDVNKCTHKGGRKTNLKVNCKGKCRKAAKAENEEGRAVSRIRKGIRQPTMFAADLSLRNPSKSFPVPQRGQRPLYPDMYGIKRRPNLRRIVIADHIIILLWLPMAAG
jgi:hypothetical protein